MAVCETVDYETVEYEKTNPSGNGLFGGMAGGLNSPKRRPYHRARPWRQRPDCSQLPDCLSLSEVSLGFAVAVDGSWWSVKGSNPKMNE